MKAAATGTKKHWIFKVTNSFNFKKPGKLSSQYVNGPSDTSVGQYWPTTVISVPTNTISMPDY